MNAAVFFKVLDSGGKEIPILSLAIYSDGVNETLLMGTESGAFSASLTESTTITLGTPTLIAGTEGKRITRIRTVYGRVAPPTSSSYALQTLVAFLSDTDVLFYDGNSVTSLPFYSGLPQDLPGQINALSFVFSGVSATQQVSLVIAGRKGMVSWDTGWTENAG